MTVQYWDGTQWIDLPGAVDIAGPTVFSMDIPAGLRDSIQGLRFVYTGNIWDRVGSVTSCPSCQIPLIERRWHAVAANRVRADGTCPGCGANVPGVFDARSQSTSHGRRYHLI